MTVIFMLFILFHLLVCSHLAYADQQTRFKKLKNYGDVWKPKMQNEIVTKTAGECAIFCVKDQVIVNSSSTLKL